MMRPVFYVRLSAYSQVQCSRLLPHAWNSGLTLLRCCAARSSCSYQKARGALKNTKGTKRMSSTIGLNLHLPTSCELRCPTASFVHRGCPVVHKLLIVVASMPMTSAECERYFCVLKRIKTDSRNRLSVKSSAALLIAATDAVRVSDFNPEACVREWHKRKKRQRDALEALDAL